MLSLEDPRWPDLRGGYRVPVDVRPLLMKLASSGDSDGGWSELWNELHHQGDVGEASYAAVPHLVRIHISRGTVDWNTYAIVATIELARESGDNPPVPGWLKAGYDEALVVLAQRGLAELSAANQPETVRSILAVLALWKGARTYGRLLLDFSEDEVLELERQAFGDLEAP